MGWQLVSVESQQSLQKSSYKIRHISTETDRQTDRHTDIHTQTDVYICTFLKLEQISERVKYLHLFIKLANKTYHRIRNERKWLVGKPKIYKPAPFKHEKCSYWWLRASNLKHEDTDLWSPITMSIYLREICKWHTVLRNMPRNDFGKNDFLPGMVVHTLIPALGR